MRGLAGGCEIVEIVALVKQRRLRRIQVLCRDILLQRAAAKGDDAAAHIGDRKHHAVAEAIVGHGDVVAADEQARFDHVVGGNALGAEMLLQRKALARRIAEAELDLRRRRDRAVGKIAARFRAVARGQRVTEKFCGELHHVMERLAALLVPRGIRRQPPAPPCRPSTPIAPRLPGTRRPRSPSRSQRCCRACRWRSRDRTASGR